MRRAYFIKALEDSLEILGLKKKFTKSNEYTENYDPRTNSIKEIRTDYFDIKDTPDEQISKHEMHRLLRNHVKNCI